MTENNSKEILSQEQERRAFGNWLAGFTDGEGCFQLNNVINRKWPLRYAELSFNLRRDDIAILNSINRYLDCGKVTKINRKVGSPQARYKVYTTREVSDKIVPFFEEFPLRAKKSKDFEVWKKGVELLRKVSDRGCSGRRKKWTHIEVTDFSDIVLECRKVRQYVDNPIVNVPSFDQDDMGHYIAGLVDGEGCFHLRVVNDGRVPYGRANFHVRLRVDDISIIKMIKNRLDCGSITYDMKRLTGGNFQCFYSVSDNTEVITKVIPFFDRYPLRAKKARDFQIWKDAARLIGNIKTKISKGKGYGNGRGVSGKWTNDESIEFIRLHDLMKSTRKYKEPDEENS